jgi:hypothetical protein
MNSTAQLTVRLDLPRELLDEEQALESKDYRLDEPEALPVDPAAREARFIDPVSVIAAISLAILAERVVHFVLTRRGQGVLVDASGQPTKVSVLAGVPQGYILLIRPDGTSESIPAAVAQSTLGEVLGKIFKS